MLQHKVIVTASVFVILFSVSFAMPALKSAEICSQQAPPTYRQLCLLEYIREYLDEPAEPMISDDTMDTKLYERGTKRQDVDHVFLRFGRRLNA